MRKKLVILTIFFVIAMTIIIFMILCYHSGGSPGFVYWSPDQSKIVYYWCEYKELWPLVPDGGYSLQQKVYLRWCTVDHLNQQKLMKIDTINFTYDIFSPHFPLLFSPDSTQIAIKGRDRIFEVDLSYGSVREISLEQWPIDNWMEPGPPVSDDIPGLTIYNLDGYEVPLGYGSGAVSPDGKRTALVNYNRQVVILEENLKKEK